MGAGGSSERRASVGVVGTTSAGGGAPVFQQREMAGGRGCSIDTRNSRDFTDISNSEAGGIITPQFTASHKKGTNGFGFVSGAGGKQTLRAPPTSSRSSPSLHDLPGHRASSFSSSDNDSNKENTIPDRLSGQAQGTKMVPVTSTTQNGITRVQPKTSTPPNQVPSSDPTPQYRSGVSRSQPGLGSNCLSCDTRRPVVGSATSSFESRTISEGVRRMPHRPAGETPGLGKTNGESGSSTSPSPTHSSPNTGDLQIEEVA